MFALLWAEPNVNLGFSADLTIGFNYSAEVDLEPGTCYCNHLGLAIMV